jgi:Domain of unknown function DUF29
MATGIPELYDKDFYVWTQRQAAALRRLAETRPNVDLDFPHLIEEVEDLGTSQRDAVRSQMRRIIEHGLKLEYSRAVDPRGGWYGSIIDARAEIDDKLSPSLRRDLDEQLPRLWMQARTKADNGLRRFGEPDAADLLPADCPYALDDLLTDGWYPANRRGLPDDR